MSADLTKATELFRHFALNPNDNEASNALLAAVRKLKGQKVDLHQISLTVGARTPAATAWTIHLQNQVQYWKDRTEEKEGEIVRLNKHALQVADKVRQLEGQLEAAQAKKPQTPRATTEWVRQVSYSPYDAREEKARIDDAINAGKITMAEGAKFKRHVSRRTDRECEWEICEVETIWRGGKAALDARTYNSLDVEYVYCPDTDDREEVSIANAPEDLAAPKAARDAAKRHQRSFRHA